MPDPSPAPPGPRPQHIFQPPTGTRDLYPAEAARRRYITDAWRRVSINHGFEEIDGPTFEHLDLYKVKSGEGIVSELFSFTRAGGEKDYALRPEFTPTLARMYAAKAASLPKPTKWFSVGPYFRAERPQRGRLREFLQWNCDFIGAESDEPPSRANADVEVMSCCVGMLRSAGLQPRDVRVRFNLRQLSEQLILFCGASESNVPRIFELLDRRGKLPEHEVLAQARVLGLDLDEFDTWCRNLQHDFQGTQDAVVTTFEDNISPIRQQRSTTFDLTPLRNLRSELTNAEILEWCDLDLRIVRGLAYYTGTVFEVIVDGERAVAGGGRYDNLIELFGGPSTPAVGFGMGDVVLANVLQDKGLMPTDAELLGLAGQHPDAFVLSNGTPEADAALPKVLAELRRATPRTKDQGPRTLPGLHARRSYKTTKNLGKLLQEAAKAGARFAVIIESAAEATIKDLATNQQDQGRTPLDRLAAELRTRLGR